MKIISGKTIFASLVFLLIMSFVVNNFLNDDNFLRDKDKYNRSSENQDKIIGVEIRQQNKQGDKFLIIADTLEEIESKGKKVILENSLTTIDQKGVLTLPNFINNQTLLELVNEAKVNQFKAYYAKSTHNIYLTEIDKKLPLDHIFNYQVVSSKGCITTDQIPENSKLKSIYGSTLFKNFLAKVVKEKNIYEYSDPFSSINIHYASDTQELGWHFDNSNFAVTLLLQKPKAGGEFQYVKNARNIEKNDMGYNSVSEIIHQKKKPIKLDIQPGT